jgi:galactokinase/mevalonate kinase-like predicted kinase
MTAVERATGVGLARAALAGNPSDGYGGAVLAVTLPAWRAEAEALAALGTGVEPANALVEATVERFRRELGVPRRGALVRWATSIPQQVGLGSSSALVIAVLRALCRRHDVALPPDELAALALAVETEDLGIAAGLQDRVAQAYEGLTFMEFDPCRYERLDPALLPPLLIAWRSEAAGDSGGVHAELRQRQGENGLSELMGELAEAARGARAGLLTGDRERFGRGVDRTFDLRRRLMPLDPRCVEMIEAARRTGAQANYTGSGGAIVAVCRDAAHLGEVAAALDRVGASTLPANAAS